MGQLGFVHTVPLGECPPRRMERSIDQCVDLLGMLPWFVFFFCLVLSEQNTWILVGWNLVFLGFLVRKLRNRTKSWRRAHLVNSD